MLSDDDLLFVPASTKAEAAARTFALTGRTDPGTRGPKRSLEALAASLGVDVDLAATNAVLGGQIADALETTWVRGRDYVDLQITLAGQNNLLRSAAGALRRLSLRSAVSIASYPRVLRAFPNFRPARNKQEAVDRISDLCGVPRDRLGPGGKEHRITFEAVAGRVAPDLLTSSQSATKHAMARSLCERLGVPWIASAASTGQTITLEGLNLLLAGTERYFEVTSSGWVTAREEGAALVKALRAEIPEYWDGRETVEDMCEDESRHWRQMEWPGFYFEEQVGSILNRAYPAPSVGGPRRTYGATSFDYASSTRVWDAKVHTVRQLFEPSGRRRNMTSSAAILNDSEAIRACVEEQGLGFLILDGMAYIDETGEFDAWHRTFALRGRDKVQYVSNSGRRRPRKSAFAPTVLRAIWISGPDDLEAGILGGWISRQKQGAQAVRAGQLRGAARNDKFHLRVQDAESLEVARESW